MDNESAIYEQMGRWSLEIFAARELLQKAEAEYQAWLDKLKQLKQAQQETTNDTEDGIGEHDSGGDPTGS